MKKIAFEVIINPGLYTPGLDSAIGRQSVYNNLFKLVQCDGLIFQDCNVDSKTMFLDIGQTKRIRSSDLYANNNGSGLIAKTYSWIDQTGHFFNQFLPQTDVSEMWNAYHGNKLTNECTLNHSMVEAQLSYGNTPRGHVGYKLLQSSPEIVLCGLPDNNQLLMADIYIAPTGYNDSSRIPTQKLTETIVTYPSSRIDTTTYKNITWEQISPLEPFSKNMGEKERNLHRALHDQMAEGMNNIREAMIFSGEMLLSSTTVDGLIEKREKVTKIGDSKISSIPDGHVYTLQEKHNNQHQGKNNRYEQKMRIDTSTIIGEGSYKKVSIAGVPIDLMELVDSGMVAPFDPVLVDGKISTVGELVKKHYEMLIEEVAIGTERIAVEANLLSKYLTREAIGLNKPENKKIAGYVEGLLQMFTHTWPAKFIQYSNQFYLERIARFLKTQNGDAEMILTRGV